MILHVGTNDIGYRAPYGDIISDFGNLIGICKKMKPSIQITVSAILPRPVDHSDTDPMIRSVNKQLNKVLSKTLRFNFAPSYSHLCMLDLLDENCLRRRTEACI